MQIVIVPNIHLWGWLGSRDMSTLVSRNHIKKEHAIYCELLQVGVYHNKSPLSPSRPFFLLPLLHLMLPAARLSPPLLFITLPVPLVPSPSPSFSSLALSCHHTLLSRLYKTAKHRSPQHIQQTDAQFVRFVVIYNL